LDSLEPSLAYQNITTRLLTWASAHRVDAGAARLRLVHERLLARMDAARPLRWVVRGGRAIDLRFDGRARPTADLDVSVADAAQTTLVEVRQLISETCRTDLGDGWCFTLMRVGRSLVENVGVVGFKAWLAATYNTQAFEVFSVDVSKKNMSTVRPEALSVPAMLTDAHVRAVVARLEFLIAEKVHAFTRPYVRARPRARSHDLVDAVALALDKELELTTLRIAAEEIFRECGTHAIPNTLPDAPAEWATAFQIHGERYGLAHLSTTQGLAILSELWERVMSVPAPVSKIS
jgi:Nucleotidyl transferase AbiEii toxin, Type IV TA system